MIRARRTWRLLWLGTSGDSPPHAVPGGSRRGAHDHYEAGDRHPLRRPVARLIGRMAAPPTEHEILDVNRRYHDVAARVLRRQVGDLVRRDRPPAGAGQDHEAARPAARARSRARSRSAPAPATSASTCCRPAWSREATCTDISPGMLATLEHNARELGLDVETAACDAAELPFEDESLRPRARPRRAPPPAGSRSQLRGVRARAQARRDAVLRRRAVALGRPARGRAQAGRGAARARRGGA